MALRYLPSLVEEEVRQCALDHLGGHPLGNLEVARADRDVIESDDPDEPVIGGDGQATDAVADHQRSRLLELHIRLAGDHRRRRVVGDRPVPGLLLGEHAQGKITIRDQSAGVAVAIADDDGADPVVAHLLGDAERRSLAGGGDHVRGHDLAELHARNGNAPDRITSARSPLHSDRSQYDPAVATKAEKERFARGASYPCPACEAELFPWSAARDPIDRSMIVVDRCEVCRLSVTRAGSTPDIEAELAGWELSRSGASIAYRTPNQLSIQGGLGGAQWAALEPDRRRLHLNRYALRRLLQQRGIEVEGVKSRFTTRGYRSMLQTLINAFTLRDNFFANARAGRLPRSSGRERLEFGLDALVSALVAIPMAILALPLEAIGSLFGRSGEIDVEARMAQGAGGV